VVLWKRTEWIKEPVGIGQLFVIQSYWQWRETDLQEDGDEVWLMCNWLYTENVEDYARLESKQQDKRKHPIKDADICVILEVGQPCNGYTVVSVGLPIIKCSGKVGFNCTNIKGIHFETGPPSFGFHCNLVCMSMHDVHLNLNKFLFFFSSYFIWLLLSNSIRVYKHVTMLLRLN